MMKSLTIVCMAMAAGALSAPTASGAPGPLPAAPRVVHQVTDKSGTTTRVYYATPTDVTVEIRNPRVTIQKHFTIGRSETTIQSGTDRVRLTLDPSGLAVSTSRGTARLSTGEAAARRARALLQQSPAFRQALTTLAGMQVSPKTPVAPLVLTTRAFLQSLSGDVSGYVAVGAWTRQALSTSLIVKVRDTTPGECWNEYVKEAVAAYDEMTDCVRNVAWWDVMGSSACHLIYDLRAIGAFSWWISCVSLDRGTTEAA
jgi:hypothetical protein